jgi:uncharacterized RDD family membrane protein YckC
MVDELRQGIVGGSPEGAGKAATRGKRWLAATSYDLVYIPFVIGFLAGLILFNAPDWLRVVILVMLNIAWVVAKDLNCSLLSPGKRMAGLKVVSADTGAAITLRQAVIRNILLIIPLVLFFGYFIEAFMLIFKGKRLGDTWAGTDVVES